MAVIIGGHASIRCAQLEDSEAIAAVHVTAWKESYTGLVPAEMLASLSVAERADRWRRILGKPDPAIATAAFVACEPGGTVVGFSSCGLQRSADLIGAGLGGEFQAIYVLRAAQRRGMGRALMGAMARDLANRGLQGGALWVLAGNQPAMNFYDVLDGVVVGVTSPFAQNCTVRPCTNSLPFGRVLKEGFATAIARFGVEATIRAHTSVCERL